MNLFNRRVAVQFGLPGDDGLRIEGLRVSFRVEHTAERAPSKASIEIYNLSKTTRGRISAPGATVSLFVGYSPTPRLVFTGKPVRGGVQLQTKGPDRVLRIDATDGGLAFASNVLVLSYVANTPVQRLLTDILAATGWGRGFVAPIPGTFPSGTTLLIGRPAELMDNLAARIAADWFVRDNALYVVPRGQTVPGEAAYVVSSTLGNLIGVPVGTKEGVRVRTLIDASLRPGRLVSLRSASVPDGTYAVRDAVFTGDSGYDANYYVDLVCRPVGAA